MGDLYSSPSASGYNANPPADDGSETEANRGKWATIISKVGSPLKTYADAINSAVAAAFAKTTGGGGVVSTGISRTGVAADQGKTIRATTSGITLTTADAESVGSPFGHHFVNTSSGSVTYDGNGAQTIDGEDSITVPAGKGFWIETDGSDWFTAGRNFDVTPQLPRGYLAGLQISQPLTSGAPDDHDITVAVGECRSTDNTANLALSAAMTKQIDASWAAGDNAGGMATGVSLDVDTWYHVHIVDTDAGGVDVGFDTSITAANLLATAGVGTEYRRLGSVLTDGAANILAFTQHGNEFLWADPPLDINTTTLSGTASLHALKTPTGIKTIAKLNLQADSGQTAEIYISSPDQNDEAPSDGTAPLSTIKSNGAISLGGFTVRTDTSSQIRIRATVSSTRLDAATLGWLDTRGRDA